MLSVYHHSPTAFSLLSSPPASGHHRHPVTTAPAAPLVVTVVFMRYSWAAPPNDRWERSLYTIYAIYIRTFVSTPCRLQWTGVRSPIHRPTLGVTSWLEADRYALIYLVGRHTSVLSPCRGCQLTLFKENAAMFFFFTDL